MKRRLGRSLILFWLVSVICCKSSIDFLPPSSSRSVADSLRRMLAVMTMNVGYFMSVLGGTFLGSFIIGDKIGAVAH